MKTTAMVLLILACSLFFFSCNSGVGDKFPEEHTYSEIYSMNVDGTGLTKLTSDKKDIAFMQYLPKSEKILFVQDGGTYMNEH
jgi:hypothetical protein